jgi:phage-related tail fiber protein
MASPQFIMTTAGLAAATAATPSGPYVHIVEFRLGSGVGYTPIQADSGLRGTLLYSGVPRSYTMVAGDTGNFICEVPSTAGPFMYGEIGLYLPGGVLFALASFPQLQQKFNLAADGFPHVLRLTV